MPDGYTLLLTVSTNAVNATLYTKLNFNFSHDLTPVAGIGRTPFVIAANPGFPPKTVPELIAYAKANPGRVNFASQGVGSSPHVCGELFKMMIGVDLVHVPYKTNYVTDLVGGQIQLAFAPIAQVIEFCKDGRLRAIAVVCAPHGVGADIIGKLAPAIVASAGDATFKSRLAALGVEPRPMNTAEFTKFVTDEIAKWAKVIQFAGIKAQ